jgi:hypothetical protein
MENCGATIDAVGRNRVSSAGFALPKNPVDRRSPQEPLDKNAITVTPSLHPFTLLTPATSLLQQLPE